MGPIKTCVAIAGVAKQLWLAFVVAAVEKTLVKVYLFLQNPN
jgi:hypothetical protein